MRPYRENKMIESPQVDWKLLLVVFAVLAALSLALAVGLAVWVFTRIRRINIPPGADFLETLRLTPFTVVLMIDLFDLALDFLSAPVAWVILGKLGLQSLRTVTAIEAVIPGTQFLPTMTAAWVVARLTDPRRGA